MLLFTPPVSIFLTSMFLPFFFLSLVSFTIFPFTFPLLLSAPVTPLSLFSCSYSLFHLAHLLAHLIYYSPHVLLLFHYTPKNYKICCIVASIQGVQLLCVFILRCPRIGCVCIEVIYVFTPGQVKNMLCLHCCFCISITC